ncbi:hypothetical protein ANCCAN_29432, partial [Ancylostoma caninum]
MCDGMKYRCIATPTNSEHARAYKDQMKLQYDKKARPAQISEGDRVFFRNYTNKVGLARKLCFPWIGQFRVLKIDHPHAIIASITSPQTKPRKVHLNQIKKVIDYTGPASTLPAIPVEEQILAELPAAEMVGYDHSNPTAAEAQDKPEAEVVPTHWYNLRS